MIKRLIIAIILLALIAGGLVGFNLFRDKMIGDYFANMPVPAATVSTVEVRPVRWTPVVEAIGTANALQGVTLTVETAGVVHEIRFASNQQVARDDLLLQLDDVVQRADVEAARTQYQLDRDNLVRAQELHRRGVTANVSLENAQAAARASEAQLARAQAVLDQRRLNAPFDGIIGIPQVDIGQYLSPGDTVATLQDLNTMRVDFSVPEQRLPEMRIGQVLQMVSENSPGVIYTGEITGINPRVDPASRLVAVRGNVVNTDHGLTPGQFMRIAAELPEQDGVLAVPQTALVSSLYGDYVYLVKPKENAPDQLEVRQSFVGVGRRSGGLVELTRGVQAGDQVVTSGQNRLSNGQPAHVNNEVNPAVSGTTGAGAGAAPGADGGAAGAGTNAGTGPATGTPGTNAAPGGTTGTDPATGAGSATGTGEAPGANGATGTPGGATGSGASPGSGG